jgi:PIN domain nuclease of toxin-antitoxin system
VDLLLDTNALLWALADDPRLGRARAALAEPGNRVYVSAVCAWEMAIKVGLGKLRVPPDLASWLPAELEAADFTPLAIDLRHALAVEYLPRHHADPFDRLLLAQATVEHLTLVTGDAQLERYAVPLLRC